MIGIVLWSDPNDCKAVFWCEDHGDLAYYSAEFDETEVTGIFTAGDMVQFDVFADAEFRRAANPELIQENAYDGLGKRLRVTAQNTQTTANTSGGKVVEFRRKSVTADPILRRSERR
jgi:hypothetical protein